MSRPASPTRWLRSVATLPVPARLRAYTAGLAAVALLLSLLVGDHPVGTPQVPWWLLTAVFAAAVTVDGTRSRALVSLPLVLGLVCTPPLGLVAAALLGTAAALAYRREPLGTALTTVLTAGASTAAAALTFQLVAADPADVSPRTWVALILAALVAEVTATAADTGGRVLGGARMRWPALVRALGRRLLATVVVTTVGILAVTALRHDGRTGFLLVLLGALGVLALHRHAGAVERHVRLRRLYDYVRGLTAIRPAGDDLPATLANLRALLPAEHVELALCTSPDAQPVREGAGGRPTTERPVELDAFERGVLDSGRPALQARTKETPDRIAVRVTAGAHSGVLRADRRAGSDRGFDESDLETLEAVGTALGAALEKGLLIEGLQQAATLDRVTGLANLDTTRLALTAMLAANPRGGVVLLLDLDRFQDVNDTLGHDAGDQVLREVARRLEHSAPGGATVGRVGGDQFAVIWRGSSDGDVAHLAALGLRAQVEGTVRIDTLSADVRMTVGLARAPEHGTDAGTLLRRAEMAMYAAKGSGSRFYEWEPGLERDGTRRLSIVRGLRQCLSADDLTVVFQPKIRLDGGSVTGLEALARWDDETLGAVRPDEFIPLAETSGLIGTLTTQVLRQALAACRRWHDLGVEVGIAVNLSARSLLDPRLVGQTAALLETHGVAPQWLTFEITETEVMNHPERSVEVLRQLRALGVRLSIDDFGTGYSSLTYVKGLPVHEVKIDKTFVPDIGEDGADRAVVRAVVDLGHSLGLEVVAEGVETGPQSELLQTLGVDCVQGFHLARPMNATDATAWLLGRTPSTV